MIDRRKFVRLESSLEVSYKTVKKNKRKAVFNALLKNISGGGICISSKQKLRAGDYLSLRIQVPCELDFIEAVGEIVWCKPAGDGHTEGGDAGLVFRDIHYQDLHRVLEYVHADGIG